MVCSVRLDYCQARIGLVEVRSIRFVCRKACWRVAEDRRVRFDYCKACRSHVEVRRVRLDCYKVC